VTGAQLVQGFAAGRLMLGTLAIALAVVYLAEALR
jgi:hypothetical protein